MRTRILIGCALLASLLCVGCTHGNLYNFTETVLSPGMSVTATNPNGTVTIEAGNGTKRIFTGDGWRKTRCLIARQERWNGSLGLYDPAASFSPYGRLLAEEGRLYFNTVSEALKHLYSGSAVYRWVYNNNGLVVGYHVEYLSNGKEPVRGVVLYQIYIDGKRPQGIPGANDGAITIKGGIIPATSKPYPAPVGYEMIYGAQEYKPDK